MKPETPNSDSAVDRFAVTPNDDPDAIAVTTKVDRFAITTKNDVPLCRHRAVQGRRCRLRVLNPQSRRCFRHAQLRRQKHRAIDLSAELTSGLTEFKSAVPINDFLSRLLLFQAEDCISPRRAAVMAYTCNLLLRTLPAINRELHPGPDESGPVCLDFSYLSRPDPDPQKEPS